MTTEAYFSKDEQAEIDELIDVVKDLPTEDRQTLMISANAYKSRNELVKQQETA